jgi:transposase-like protein
MNYFVAVVFPAAREQRCWWHKQANVLATPPKSPGPTNADFRDIGAAQSRTL